MTTATTALPGPREAILAGHKHWYSTVQVSKRARRDVGQAAIDHELALAEQDHRRAMLRELWMTEEEIAARYTTAWGEPESMEWRETGERDDEGEPVRERVPLAEARFVGYRLTTRPHRYPQPGAVYTLAVSLPEEPLSLIGLCAILRDLNEQHGDFPKALRLHPERAAEYRNLYGWTLPDTMTFNGIPVQLQRVTRDVVVAVYPLVR